MRSSLLIASSTLVLLAACDSGRMLDNAQNPSPSGQVVVVSDAGPTTGRVDARDTNPIAPLDAGPGCGVSPLDGSLSSTYFTLGCPPEEASCPIDRSMVIEGYGGFPLDEPVGGCRIGVGAYLSSARLVLARRSQVSVEVHTSESVKYVTSMRQMCFLDLSRCAEDDSNVQTLDAGEYTLEVVLDRAMAFSLEVDITPL